MSDDSQFLKFQSTADLNAVPRGGTFSGTWRVRNNGTTAWERGYHLYHRVKKLKVRTRLPLFEATGLHGVAPGEEVDITLSFTAPKVAGQYRHVFQIANGKGKPFGDRFWVEIVVVEEQAAGNVDGPARAGLQTGMNISPDAPHSNPMNVGVLRGIDWVRYPFKVADKRRSVADSFAEYDPIVNAYAQKEINTLFVLNQQTVGGENAPWKDSEEWSSYAKRFASAAGEIAEHYARLGDKVAYEIWNEGDNPKTAKFSVYVTPQQFAPLLWQAANAIRAVSPESKIIFGGLSTDHKEASAYVNRVRRELGGELPVDAIGIHPYGRWPVRRPFSGWGFGPLNEELDGYKNSVPEPLWITEIGIVGRDNPLSEKRHTAVASFIRDLYKTIAHERAAQVPVVIWFSWSDNMENAGIVRGDGSIKPKIFEAFVTVRDRKVDGLT